MTREVNDDGAWRGEGWPRQEGQAQGGPGQEGEVGTTTSSEFDPELFYHQLLEQRRWILVPTCAVCGVTQDEHAGRQHAFTPEGVPVDTAQFGPKRSDRARQGDDATRRVSTSYGASQAPFDPVLRQALIDKGILTAQDLQEASDKIRLVTEAVVGSGGAPPQPWGRGYRG